MARTRNSGKDFTRLLEDSPLPVYALDDTRHIVYCNAACAAWVGVEAEMLVGQECVYQVPDATDPALLAAARLCPPPTVFAGQTQSAQVSALGAGGVLKFRSGTFFPLSDGHDGSAAVMALLQGHDEAPATADTRSAGASESSAQLHDLVARFRAGLERRYRPDSLIGIHPAVARVRAQIDIAARTGACTLVVGPVGVGKDHVARAIHYSAGGDGNLVSLACAVLEPPLMQSTLRALVARNAAADCLAGTLLLNDVAALARDVQAELLTMIQQDRLRMRVVATERQDLSAAVAAGDFLPELACTLSTLQIELPALAQRIQDLPLLAQAFLEECNQAGKHQLAGFTPEALDALAGYAWPGNLDELAAVVRAAHASAQVGEVTVRDLPRQIHLAGQAMRHPAPTSEAISLDEFLGRVERELIERALRRAKGNKSKAAKLLGMTRPKLYRRLVQLGMEAADETTGS